MTTFCYYLAHYGKDWFEHSLRSVENHVDEIFIFYSEKPSFGHTTNIPCPESRQDLVDIAKNHKCRWYDVSRFPHEGLERDYAIKTCKDAGAEIVVVTDTDEIWDQNYLPYAIDFVKQSNDHWHWRTNFRHLWKSVNWICDDPAMPMRILDVRHPQNFNGDGYIHKRSDTDVVYHFGYAQNPAVIDYKLRIHGHSHEIRPNWYNEKFMAWYPGMTDVHPTNIDFWAPVPYNRHLIQNLIGDHKYYGVDIIK